MKAKMKMKNTSVRCYKKRGFRSHSDHSLSQLLEIASYKKQINDLRKNNRLLTSALQESLVESASQSNLLRNYAKDANQILFAQIKLNEMARNLAKFATDLEDVRNCLNISFPAEVNFFQKKGPSAGTIVKVPDVSAIEEEPELLENEPESCEDSPDTPDEVFFNDLERNENSTINDIETPPVVFTNDVQEIQKKRSNSSDKISLTPQLNIDFPYFKHKRSTKSRGKTPSLGKKSSISGGLVTHRKSASSPLIHQDCAGINETVLKSPIVKNIENESENLKMPSHNQSSDPIINEKGSVVVKIDLNQLSESDEEICPLQSQRIGNNSPIVAKFDDNSKILQNVPVKNENCENDDLYSEGNLEQLTEVSQLHDVVLPEIDEYDPEIQNVGSLTFCDSDDDGDDEKENTVSPTIRLSRSKKQNVGSLTFCDSDDDGDSEKKDTVSPTVRLSRSKKVNVGSLTFSDSDDDGGDDEMKNSVSSSVRSCRLKKPLKYTDYALSDESDTESPFKKAVTKRSGSKRIKLNSFPVDKSCENAPTKIATEVASDGKEIADEVSSDVKDIAEADFSVYSLDVSNSKRTGKKTKKKPSSAKSKNKKVNDMPRPLFQKCSVTKLKGGDFKFSKFETVVESKSISTQSRKSLQNSCASPGGILKKARSSLINFEDKKNDAALNETKDTDNMHDSKQPSMFQTPKRVSFAPVDLVCKFEKMSESKAIADNRKVRRTSKSAVEFEELFVKADQSKISPITLDNSSDKTDMQKLKNSPLINVELPLSKDIEDSKKVRQKSKSSIELEELFKGEVQPETSPVTLDNSSGGTDVQKLNNSPLFDIELPESKDIADNMKVRRKSKSAMELKELFKEAAQSETFLPKIGDSSEKTDAQKSNNTILFDFSDVTELYTLTFPLNIQNPLLPADGIASSEPSAPIVSEQTELVNNECLTKSPKITNSPVNVGKVSSKRDEHDQVESQYGSEKTRKVVDILFLESPMSLLKPPKRKSLFKESPKDDLKENINSDHSAREKKNSLKKKTSTNKKSSTPTNTIKKSSSSKSQTKIHSKISSKKNKKNNLEMKSLEQSPVLTDATNVMALTDECRSRRRSKQVSYKEPSLTKKLRRE